MEKRIILALILSVLVLGLYSAHVKKFYRYPIANKEDMMTRAVEPTPIGLAGRTPTRPTGLAEPAPTEIAQQPPAESTQPGWLSRFSRRPTEAQQSKPLGGIAKFLLKGLKFFHSYLHNWGLSIIALSVVIWAVLLPLTTKSLTSAKRMQSLQPKIEALRQQYKDQPQKLNKQIFELYRQEKMNPLGGCLPLIFQMPIFIGLYQMLSRTQEIKGANFLWIKDLASTDKFYILPFKIPILGNELNLLPILMMILMFLQQKVSLKTTGGASSEQQKMFATIFPLMFGVLFYHFPAGLVLYWSVNSLLMFIHQLKINRPAQAPLQTPS